MMRYLLVLILAAAVAGCGSVPKVDTGYKGRLAAQPITINIEGTGNVVSVAAEPSDPGDAAEDALKYMDELKSIIPDIAKKVAAGEIKPSWLDRLKFWQGDKVSDQVVADPDPPDPGAALDALPDPGVLE